ncbi:helix-turn-helix domain-containing protein [Streptomyces sp. NPDC013178]|uniref:ATP-binding protein n=1 Tax=Streptomyces sp. NPDC013178 TaxID=3155118 RepID=UPI0033E52D8E
MMDKGDSVVPETEFGPLLRRLRLAAGLTIEGLSETSGVSARGIGNLERGERTVPQRRTVAALADGLGLDEVGRERLLAAARAGRARRASDEPSTRAWASAARPMTFVGREDVLSRLSALTDEIVSGLGSQQPVIVVSGAPGVGKTTTVMEATRRLAHRFPDGQLTVHLQGMDDSPPRWPELMLRVLKTLGVSDGDLLRAGPRGHPELYRQAFAERRLLLVLDNARDEAQVRPLLPGTGEGLTLVTSRRMLTGLDSVERVQLGELTARESVALLADLVGPERGRTEPRALAEVAELCGYLPLALRVAGNSLTARSGWTVRRLADLLGTEERRLETLAGNDAGVAAAFDLSYRQLTPEAARLFRRLALVDGPDFSAPCAATLTGQEVFDTEDVLEELVESGLLIGSEAGRYSFHDLLRIFAHGRLEAQEDATEAAVVKGSMHRWLLETAVTAGRWFEPAYGPPSQDWDGTVDLSSAEAARDWLQAEGANWLAAFRAAAAAGDHSTVVEVAESLHWFSDQWVFWGHWTEVFATASAAAQALGDPLWEATHLNYHAWALLVCEGRYQDSVVCAVKAREAARRAENLVQEAWSHNYQGWALRMQQDYQEAARHNERAAHLFDSADDVYGALQAMAGYMQNLTLAGRAAEMVKKLPEALAYLAQVGDGIEPHIRRLTELNLHSAAGGAFRQMEQWEDASAHYRIAIMLSREIGNASTESRNLVRLGEAMLMAGRAEEARDAFARCLDIGMYADPAYLAMARDHIRRMST